MPHKMGRMNLTLKIMGIHQSQEKYINKQMIQRKTISLITILVSMLSCFWQIFLRVVFVLLRLFLAPLPTALILLFVCCCESKALRFVQITVDLSGHHISKKLRLYRTARRTFEFGRTYVVRPRGKHQATIVWLHGLGDNGSSWSQLLENLSLTNIKWICPTAPTRPVSLLGGFPCNAWCDVGELSEDVPDDFEGLDASAAHIANLLSTEPADVKLGIGGFSMGAATALYSATCFTQGKYSNGYSYTVNLRAIIGLSGWLPGSRNIRKKIEATHDAVRRAASLPILLCHGTSDEVVPCMYGEKSTQVLSSSGFRCLNFKTYDGLGHYTVPKEMDDVCQWLTARLGLEGSRS